MRQLPRVNSLYEAVQTVIKENKSDRYNPTYFTRSIANSTNLVKTCSDLIRSRSSYSALSDALLSHPDLLTLEDFVAVYGQAWGFTDEVVKLAQQRAGDFDGLVKHRRHGYA